MSTAVAKPHRPCTEYNIFFQLERAYILQVLLHADPAVDAAEVFHPSQTTYAGLPPLPCRYESLVLLYDWHLPGKEQRRKRKHRKSHGAISFHELSNKIASAWKAVDADVKTYCSQVCAVGMIRYKAAMKEWKRSGGDQKTASAKNRHQMLAKASRTKKSEDTKVDKNLEKKKLDDVTSEKITLKVLPQDTSIKDETKCVQAPAPVLSEIFTMEEMDQAFENDIVFMEQEVTLGMMWGSLSTDIAISSDTIENVQGAQDADFIRAKSHTLDEPKAVRNASIVSHETVDMDDNEIINIWNNSELASNHRYCHDNTPELSNTATHQVVTNEDTSVQQDSMFSLKGYNESVHGNMQQMISMLEQQMARWENMEHCVRRNSLVACSA